MKSVRIAADQVKLYAQIQVMGAPGEERRVDASAVACETSPSPVEHVEDSLPEGQVLPGDVDSPRTPVQPDSDGRSYAVVDKEAAIRLVEASLRRSATESIMRFRRKLGEQVPQAEPKNSSCFKP